MAQQQQQRELESVVLEDASSSSNSLLQNSRCCFCFPCFGNSTFSSSSFTTGGGGIAFWERIGGGGGTSSSSSPQKKIQFLQSSEKDNLWSRAFRKIREWSEIVAGPRWKTFIRRFNRNRSGGGGNRNGKFQYDPLSYALNFDEGGGGQHGEEAEDYPPPRFRDFPTRIMINNKIPQDVAIEMLSQLPVESLLRFKCVHKSWYALIESPEFVKMQLRSGNKNILYLPLLSRRERDDNEEHKITLSMLRYDGEVASFSVRDVDMSIVKERFSINISCHCDGIICFYTHNHAIIANPGIRQFRALPESCIPLPDPYDIDDGYLDFSREIKALGLGFDFKSKDYKLVRVLEFCSPFNSPGQSYDVEVIILGSNSWRQIESLHPGHYQINDWLSSYWNGVYYWPTLNILSNGFGLLSFNFSEEVFQFISIPEFVCLGMYDRYPEYGMIEFNGTQALISYFTHTDGYFDIWDMDGWTKILTTEHLKMDVLTPLGFLKKNQLLLLLSSGHVASYSFITNQMKILPIDDEDEVTYYDGVGYRSSLVSIIK